LLDFLKHKMKSEVLLKKKKKLKMNPKTRKVENVLTTIVVLRKALFL